MVKIKKTIILLIVITVVLISVLIIAMTLLSKNTYSLCSSQSSPETKEVFKYLQKQYKNKILIGQQLSCDGTELDYIYNITSKQPAIAGFDMINQTIGWHDAAVTDAIAWHHETGGLVSFTWHWFTPSGANGTKRGTWESNKTSFDIIKAVTPGTDEYEYITRDIRAIADQLLLLEEARVPVLWRPMHEAGNPYFWWSSKGSFYYKELWKLMFTILNDEYCLSNLIWVFSGYASEWDYYPGDDMCDIIATDIYFEQMLSSQLTDEITGEANFKALNSLKTKKMIALTEVDITPDIWLLEKNKVHWLWYMPWYGGYITTEKYTTKAMLMEAYESEYCITADMLPNWNNGSQKGISSQIRTNK